MTNLRVMYTGDNSWGLFFETSAGWEILEEFKTRLEAQEALELEIGN